MQMNVGILFFRFILTEPEVINVIDALEPLDATSCMPTTEYLYIEYIYGNKCSYTSALDGFEYFLKCWT